MLLYCLSWVSAFLLLLAITFSLAVTLYFVAELVEENSVISARVIRTMIFCDVFLYLLLIPFESFPWTVIIGGLTAQLFHFMLMRTFPAIELKSFWFAGTIGLLFINHFFVFRHFAVTYYPLNEIVAFFMLYMWIVPMSLLVSLSANDMVLPTYSNSNSLGRNTENNFLSGSGTQYVHKRKGGYSLKNLLNFIKEEYLPIVGIGQKKSF